MTEQLNAYELLYKDVSFHDSRMDLKDNKKEEQKIFSKRTELFKAIESLDCYNDMMESNQNFKTTGNLYSNKKLDSFGADIKKLALVYEKSKDKYITCNLALIITQLKLTNQDDFLDKFQEAAIYFQRAFNTFDVNSGLAFTTYAYTYIKYGIINAHKKDNIISIKDDVRNTLNRIKELRTKLAPRNPTITEILEAFPQLSIEKIEAALFLEQSTASLNTPVSFDGESFGQVMDTVVDDTNINMEEMVEQGLLNKLIKKIIQNDNNFTKRDKKILIMRFGIDLPDDYTLEEVGIQFNLTRERVRQLEKKALTLLKEKYGHKLKEFY